VNNKTAVIIGGTSGIGRRTAERLLDDGWRIWATGTREKWPDTPSGEAFSYQQCDVRSAEDITRLFQRVGEVSGSLDALVYSAGANLPGELAAIPIEHAQRMLDVNLTGAWLSVRAAVPLLSVNATTADPSRVVVVGSIGGIRPKISSGIYSASKAAAHVIANVFAVELAPAGITVNVVAPGSTDTPMFSAATGTGTSTGYQASAASPLGRIAQTDDVADAILYLLGDQSRYINGVVLPVDGGQRAAYVNR
jgi:NAD(P)-dependent dehydrogenase (short-subunit alcohol dehydrogenase family)